MRADGTACLVLTAAAAGACATLAGCASGVSAQAPAASTLTSTQQVESQRPGHAARPPQASAAGTAARKGTPTAQTSQPTVAPAPASHSPTSSRNVSAMLTSGLYTDAPDGTPHYVLSFTSSAGSVIRGSVSFLYQDGRIATVGSYAGTLSGSGKITLTLGDGKVLSGRYTAGRLNLAGCAAALPLATVAGDCTFTYHGHVP
jgi:hypothetical protein